MWTIRWWTLNSGRGHFFVAPSEAARESWVDALTLVHAIVSRGGGHNLQDELQAAAAAAAADDDDGAAAMKKASGGGKRTTAS